MPEAVEPAKAILADILAGEVPQEGATAHLNGRPYKMAGGILRDETRPDDSASALAEFYRKHWSLEGAYDDRASDEYQAEIFTAMFGDNFTNVADAVPAGTRVLDFGCGSGVAGRVYFGPVYDRIRYVGVDMSGSVDEAREEFAERRLAAAFVQGEVASLPFKPGAFDIVFCPGVLHYTGDIAASIGHLGRVLRGGGTFITWIYKEQKPIRRFTDQFLRAHFSKMTPEDAFEAMKPLTRLGIALGEAKAKIVVPQNIPVLEIEKGEYDLQRFIYYHVLKLFYHPDLTFTRHNVNNWNAYYPRDVLFPSLDEVRRAFAANGFEITYLNPQGNGVAVVARKSVAADAHAPAAHTTSPSRSAGPSFSAPERRRGKG